MKKLLLLLSLFSVFACKKEKSAEEQLAFDIELIKKYITDKSLTALSTPEGVYYTIDIVGTGTQMPTPSNIVVAKYKGSFLDGTVFEEDTKGFESRLSNVILGWQIGFQKFKKGGKGKLLIPSGLAYGNVAQGRIPKNSVLIFEIELLDIK